ncbi:endonuclease/exonuclease/phosphatase family protein [Algisphaera agarilytica]|uniref:Endonuclease/exonuclease/phosphatase (EEP) superfamily protein YafD n=1 Tax=Algisphaera agarilytica TaxID=1385975 RepID=A0A7X0H564_9BACT|nr:endonuclease/exonuclease/phosphatase family protein [Algisphaera agarilytica]MBB6429328.1 endonuclease/exonuclease/phosphatase (EEP) superfamily protein YafD [Algisphaera agarilytica]
MTDRDPVTGVPTTLRGSAALLLWMLGAASAFASVLGLLGDRPWFLDLFAHFRLQYAAGLVIAVIGMGLLKKWVSTGVFGAALVLNGVLLAPLWIAPAQPQSGGPELRLVAFNVLTSNTQKQAVTDWLNTTDADVLILQEVNQVWIEHLDHELVGFYRLQTASTREDNFGIAAYIRGGLVVDEFDSVIDTAEVPAIHVVLEFQGQKIRIMGVHTLPPVGSAYSRFRREQLRDASARVTQSEEPVVVAGDLNATRWSSPLRRLLRETELRDSAEGFGHQGTWPSSLAWTGMIPIDHVLVSPDIRVEDRWVGPALGSDHCPVVVDLVLP